MINKLFIVFTSVLLTLGAGCSKFDTDFGSFSSAAEETFDEQSANESIKSKMLGFWAPDVDKSLEEILKEWGAGQKEKEGAVPFIKDMLSTTLIEITNEEIITTAFGKHQDKVNYKITQINGITGLIGLNLWGGKGEEADGSAKFENDSLSLVKPGKPALLLNRITKAEFTKRKTATKKSPFPGK